MRLAFSSVGTLFALKPSNVFFVQVVHVDVLVQNRFVLSLERTLLAFAPFNVVFV